MSTDDIVIILAMSFSFMYGALVGWAIANRSATKALVAEREREGKQE